MIFVINLLGGSESKAQMVFPHGTVSTLVLVITSVSLCSWRSISVSGLCLAPVEFSVSGLLSPRLLAQTCFCKCPWWIGSCRDPGLGLVSYRTLALIYSLRGSRFGVHPDPQWTWFRPTPSKVPDSQPDLTEVYGYCLLPLTSQINA